MAYTLSQQLESPRPASSVRLASRTTVLAGTTGVFCIAVLIVSVWAAPRPPAAPALRSAALGCLAVSRSDACPRPGPVRSAGRAGLQRAASARQLRFSHPEPSPRARKAAGAALEKLLSAGPYSRAHLSARPNGENKRTAYLNALVKCNPDYHHGL